MPPHNLDLEAAAKQACACSGAMRWRSLERFGENMASITGEKSVENGFRYEVSDVVRGMLLEAACNVYDGEVMRVTLMISPTDKMTVEEKKGELCLTRREVRERS